MKKYLFGLAAIVFLSGCSFIIGKHPSPENDGVCVPCIERTDKYGFGLFWKDKWYPYLGYKYENNVSFIKNLNETK